MPANTPEVFQSPSFEVTLAQSDLIAKIMKRACSPKAIDTPAMVSKKERLSVEMSLTACVAQGCPLNLQGLLDADDFNFGHDLWGIDRHLCRNTGKLLNCFVPRFARHGVVARKVEAVQS